MFGVSLQDRLKAAVNTLEATGSSLHARSLANQQLLDAENNRPGTPSIKSPPSATSPQVGQLPETPQKGGEEKHAIAEAGIHPSVSTSQLAENALSGLRRSFHFGGRSQTDLAGIVDGSSSAPVSPGAQELKAIVSPGPASAGATSSDSTSLKAPTTIFSVGSGDASEAITPIPKSPLAGTPTPTRSAKRILDTREPADIPLPPSPDLSAVPSASVVDPLGALSLDGSGDVAGLGIALAGGAGSDADAKTNGDDTLVDSEGTASKLAAAERRYEDLSQRFTTLLTQFHKANQILKDLTPLEGGLGDPEALEGWVRMMNGKVGMMGEEMSRLASKMELQESRIEELRDTHRLEQSSQSEVIAKLRSDLSDAQSKITSSTTSSETLTQLRADLSKAQTQAKEEEEKRTKAISLLKTVRLKLVKTEKDKEESEKDRANERAERSRAMDEVERVKAEREREVNNLRKGFERELAGVKEKAEKDLKDRKADWELEMITTKATQAKELSQKSTKIAGLESILKELNIEKQQTHSVLQSKQAEAESAKAEMEIMRTKTKEFEWQLREAEERCALLEAGDQGRSNSGLDIPDGRSESTSPGLGAASPHDVQRLLAESESRAESKLSDLRTRIRALEKERNEMEEEWAGKVQERVLELEKMRRVLQEKDREYAESLEGLKERERKIEDGESKVKQLEADIIRLRTKVEEVKSDKTVAVEAERKAHEELAALQNQITSLQSQLDESRTHVTHLKSTNKTLRDEMRKIQSSVQLMERQRNPGVGYWSAGAGGSTGPAASSSVSVAGSGVLSPPLPSESPAPGRKSLESVRTTTATELGSESGRNQEEEEVNLEYLRNVILQFLEHKEMRPNLVRVMSVILRFTPQELRRLNAKLLT